MNDDTDNSGGESDELMQILDEIMDEITNPPDTDEMAELDGDYGFRKLEVEAVLGLASYLSTYSNELSERLYPQGYDSEVQHSGLKELFADVLKQERALHRYQLSDEWKQRYHTWLKGHVDKVKQQRPRELIGKAVRITTHVEASRSFVPVVGTEGIIVRIETHIPSDNPLNWYYLFSVRYQLPAVLTDDSVLVNIDILDKNPSRKDLKKFLAKWGVESVWWERDNLPYAETYFKLDEIEIIN